MNKTFGFVGREKEIERLRALHTLRKHVLVVGAAGIGKTALLRQVRHCCPLLICEQTSNLSRICESIERELGWTDSKLNIVERKNRLLLYFQGRGELIAFDHVARTPPRVARCIAELGERVPIWIACRSDRPRAIGHVWESLYNFTRFEIAPLAAADTRSLIAQAVAQGNIQASARKHTDELYRMSGGNPRMLEELLIELSSREYQMDRSFGLNLLALDREIHEIDLAIKATAEERATP